MKQPVFQGSCTAIITPFSAEGIDFARLERQLDFQAENNIRAIVVAGTTGENPTLELYEYEKLIDFTAQHIAGRMKLIVGIGGNNTQHCVDKARYAAYCGADAVLQTAPYYNKTTQAGLFAHFASVADTSELPLILYNVPSRTALPISAETYSKLAQHPNVNGTKEASGDFTLISRIAVECGDDLHLWSGNDDNTLAMMALGAIGVISVASNLIPKEITQLCEVCLSGDFASARLYNRKLNELFRLLFAETNPIPVKAAMKLADLDSGISRPPLVDATPQLRDALEKEMQRLNLLPTN